MTTRLLRLAFTFTAAATLFAACASEPPAPIQRKSVQKVEATVVEVDRRPSVS